MNTIAVIVAAGRGTRAALNAGEPKQYRTLGGVPALRRCLSVFLDHDRIDGVLSVIHKDDADRYRKATAALGSKLLPPVVGGLTRQDSVRAGLEALAIAPPRRVLIHDAARPLTPPSLIAKVVDQLLHSDGAIAAIPLRDTLKRTSGERILDTVDRANLSCAQTPQGFGFAKILDAHRAAAAGRVPDFTDDAAIAEWHGLHVSVVEGSVLNMKLTTNEDFALAERLVAAPANSGEYRTGNGFDVHAFGDGDHVMLCGVRVPHNRALRGHSDADVALHALTDALLGAIGDGDIGAHFPPSDARWKGVASEIFVRDAAKRVQAKRARIVNVDLTILCESPKVGPHRDAMRANIAAMLNIEVARVSVKATTTEGLGFLGRREGIAAIAAATVRLG